MAIVLRLISLFMLSLCFSQAWGMVTTPSFEPFYGYDGSSSYRYVAHEVEKSNIYGKNNVYDDGSNLLVCCSE